MVFDQTPAADVVVWVFDTALWTSGKYLYQDQEDTTSVKTALQCEINHKDLYVVEIYVSVNTCALWPVLNVIFCILFAYDSFAILLLCE